MQYGTKKHRHSFGCDGVFLYSLSFPFRFRFGRGAFGFFLAKESRRVFCTVTDGENENPQVFISLGEALQFVPGDVDEVLCRPFGIRQEFQEGFSHLLPGPVGDVVAVLVFPFPIDGGFRQEVVDGFGDIFF